MGNTVDIIGIVKELPLTGGMVALVDADDYDRLSRFKWYAKKRLRKGAEPCYYAVRSEWKDGRTRTVRMHRLIMRAKPGEDVDHRNGNGLDNRKENLRLCSRSENTRAAHVLKGGKSRYKGVWHRSEHPFSPWAASIRTDEGLKHLGYFKTEEEAAVAYDIAALEHHGDYAVTNLLSKYSIDKFRVMQSKLRIAVEALDSTLPIINETIGRHQGGSYHACRVRADNEVSKKIIEEALSQIRSLPTQ